MGVALVAEDDMSTMLVICSILKKMGHLPIRARNGRIAWDILCDNADNIDLVITDLMMPEMNGYALIEQIRKHKQTCNLPIIVQSAYLEVKGASNSFRDDVEAIVPKPLDRGLLMLYIEKLMPRDTP